MVCPVGAMGCMSVYTHTHMYERTCIYVSVCVHRKEKSHGNPVLAHTAEPSPVSPSMIFSSREESATCCPARLPHPICAPEGHRPATCPVPLREDSLRGPPGLLHLGWAALCPRPGPRCPLPLPRTPAQHGHLLQSWAPQASPSSSPPAPRSHALPQAAPLGPGCFRRRRRQLCAFQPKQKQQKRT